MKDTMRKPGGSGLRFYETGRFRIAAISLLMLLILCVRLYYYTGPIFANSQDEGIYLNMYAGALIFHNPVTFSQYAHVNFNNFTDCKCNPADEFQFYVGFIYPEMLLLKLFGFSADLAIYYVIFTSVVEGLFIFLIIENISKFRPAVLGTILFAFLPADVLFSTHVQPLVPAMMLVAISTYAFVVASEKRNGRLLYLLSGVFAGLAFITNPLGALTFILFALICAIRAVKGGASGRKENVVDLALIIVGFIAAYSLIGAVYLAESGNYLLYPELSRAVYSFQDSTQPIATHCLSTNLCFNYITGYPSYYPSILADLPISYDSYLRYSAISFFVFVAAAAFSMIDKKAGKRSLAFVLMFLFYLMAIMALPTKVASDNNTLHVYLIGEATYAITILTLPLIVVSALGLEALLVRKRTLLGLIVIAVMVTAVACDVADLNRDIGYYRASMSTAHAFVDYIGLHPNGIFYANFLFAGEANLLSGYRYQVRQLHNCGAMYLSVLQKYANVYVATGGTISMDIDPSYVDSFDSCVLPNVTEYNLVYAAGNPYSNYSGDAPPLKIYGR